MACQENRISAGGAQVKLTRMPVDARELPVSQYAKLKSLAISNARTRFGLRQQNPRVSQGGLDPEVIRTLSEQRAYLQRSREQGQFPGKSQPRDPRLIAHTLTASASSCLGPVIVAVNGQAKDAIFTPRLGDNSFVIEGCGFGDAHGAVFLRPETKGASPASVALQAGPWSDSTIEARLDPRLAGVPDLLVTLVVRLPDGQTVELAGCRFVALRGEAIALRSMPASWVNLSMTAAISHALPQLEYLSPPLKSREVPHDASGSSALIVRSGSGLFDPGSDVYDLSGLGPGWVVDSVQLQTYSPSCPGDVTSNARSGDWSTSFSERGFAVTWATEECHSFIPPVFRFGVASSEYAVKVWVSGPVGTQPWSVTDHREFGPM